MYRTRKVEISPKHELYEWCCHITSCTNNLYNAALFRIRQVISSLPKEPSTLSANEKKVWAEIEDALPYMRHADSRPEPGKSRISYSFLNELMYVTRNPDYFAEGLPRQTAQQTLRGVVHDTDSYYRAIREYSFNPSRFSGKPRLPRYRKKDGKCTAIITNQDCRLVQQTDGKVYAKLPLTKISLCIGKGIQGNLKQVTIKPAGERFLLSFILEDPVLVSPRKKSVRICAIDPGVENLAAVTNNAGLPCLLYKGSAIKAANQLYNKKLSQFSFKEKLSEEDRVSIRVLLQKRNHVIDDQMLKTCKSMIRWCVENNIDTIVIGSAVSREHVQQSRVLGDQGFAQVPFGRMREILSYQAERNGLRFIVQEESFTSKASFLDDDMMDPPPHLNGTEFSGVRFFNNENGLSSRLYQAKDGTILNADLNASANILKKAFPHAFMEGVPPDFNQVIVIHHPDAETDKANRTQQKAQNTGISRSKQKRLDKKQ